jgi:hypothetical protein
VRPFAHYYIGTFVRPRRTLDSLAADARRLRQGLCAVLVTAAFYTMVYAFLILGGGRPSPPWLAIPIEVYYRYNVFLLAPSVFMGWILASGVVQLLARFFAGTGSFEDTASVFGFGIAIPIWAALLHDLVESFLGAVQVINQREYEIALNSPTPRLRDGPYRRPRAHWIPRARKLMYAGFASTSSRCPGVKQNTLPLPH